MSEQNKKFPPGSIVMLSSGEYSDYSWNAVFVTLAEVDLEVEAQAYAVELRVKLAPIVTGKLFVLFRH